MATPSKRHMNWTGTTWTPSGGSAAVWTGVTNVAIDPRGSVKANSGDWDRFPTTKVADFSDPMITVTFKDLTALNAVAQGSRGAFTSIHNDAKNGTQAASGGYTVTMANAIIENKPTGGAHREYGEGQVTISAESTDGLTNPLTYAAL
jgi:hypothetical protein